MQTLEESITQYINAWNVSGLENIKSALHECWTIESTYVDTQNILVKGIDGLAVLINEFHKQMPGHKLQQLSKADYHTNSGRFLWENTSVTGEKTVGMDYFEYNDKNQITRIIGFFGPFRELSHS